MSDPVKPRLLPLSSASNPLPDLTLSCSASRPDDGGVALRQDHGPAAAGARVFPRGLLRKEVPFLLTGKRARKKEENGKETHVFGEILSSAPGGREGRREEDYLPLRKAPLVRGDIQPLLFNWQ